MNIFIFPKVDFGSLLFHQGFATECFRLNLSVDGKPRSGGLSAHPCLCCFKNMVSWFEIVIVNIVLNRYLFIRLCRAIFFSTSGRFRSKTHFVFSVAIQEVTYRICIQRHWQKHGIYFPWKKPAEEKQNKLHFRDCVPQVWVISRYIALYPWTDHLILTLFIQNE